MLTESEIIAQHRDALTKARSCCQRLKQNAVEIVPRGIAYGELRAAIKQLEGTARQMFHWRGDDARWLKLGALYAKAAHTAQRLLRHENWLAFGDFDEIFARGERHLMDLSERPTGRSVEKLILPGAIDRWFEQAPPRYH